MWIICCGLYRSGSTLHYQIISDILEKYRNATRVGYDETFINSKKKYCSENRNKLLVLKKHNFSEDVVNEVRLGNAHCFFTYRDIRDIFLSHKNKFKISFWDLYGSGFLESVLNNFYNWSKLERIYLAKYENFTSNIQEEAIRILNHFNIPVDIEYLNELKPKYSIENQIRTINKNKNHFESINEQIKYDKKSLLHDNHINKGKINGWLEELEPYQILLIENKAKEYLTTNNYPLLYQENFFKYLHGAIYLKLRLIYHTLKKLFFVK